MNVELTAEKTFMSYAEQFKLNIKAKIGADFPPAI